MKRLSDRFAEAAATCASLGELGALLHDASRELGFRYYAMLHHRSLLDEGACLIRLDNYPADWSEELVRAKLALHDPVHFASRHSIGPFTWDGLDALVQLDPQQRGVLDRSRTFGLGNGFTVPANIFGEPAASCSFALEQWVEVPAIRLACATLVGMHAFRAARRLAAKAPPPARTHLSRRQVQCLQLLADGKTDWEIASILGLRPETVRHYVKRARAAYDVVSRSQLVRLGLSDAWLDF